MQNEVLRLSVAAMQRASDLKREIVNDERGEGMISFLIIAVGVAVAAIAVWAFVNQLIIDKTGQLDMGDAPTTTIP